MKMRPRTFSLVCLTSIFIVISAAEARSMDIDRRERRYDENVVAQKSNEKLLEELALARKGSSCTTTSCKKKTPTLDENVVAQKKLLEERALVREDPCITTSCKKKTPTLDENVVAQKANEKLLEEVALERADRCPTTSCKLVNKRKAYNIGYAKNAQWHDYPRYVNDNGNDNGNAHWRIPHYANDNGNAQWYDNPPYADDEGNPQMKINDNYAGEDLSSQMKRNQDDEVSDNEILALLLKLKKGDRQKDNA